MSDRDDIAQLISDLGLLVDARDWDGLRELFADEVDVDYTSLNGGQPQRVPPADLVGGWKQMLEPLVATHHLISNHSVTLDGDRASLAANVTATHVPQEREHWVVGGRYDVMARSINGRWHINALTLTVRWQTGSQDIMGADT